MISFLIIFGLILNSSFTGATSLSTNCINGQCTTCIDGRCTVTHSEQQTGPIQNYNQQQSQQSFVSNTDTGTSSMSTTCINGKCTVIRNGQQIS
uniref:Secreted protein n=1 Tax=Panagrolaimus sp. PS1159 TaxID=55785 RepID=A0AC35FTQ4_9BILA